MRRRRRLLRRRKKEKKKVAEEEKKKADVEELSLVYVSLILEVTKTHITREDERFNHYQKKKDWITYYH